jgi:hypothetical protein
MSDLANAPIHTSRKRSSVFEVSGSVLAMVYALLIASNTGSEMLWFTLLLVSSCLFAGWGIIDKRWTFFVATVFLFWVCHGGADPVDVAAVELYLLSY